MHLASVSIRATRVKANTALLQCQPVTTSAFSYIICAWAPPKWAYARDVEHVLVGQRQEVPRRRGAHIEWEFDKTVDTASYLFKVGDLSIANRRIWPPVLSRLSPRRESSGLAAPKT